MTPHVLLQPDLDLSIVQWRKRVDPIWNTEFDLPDIMLEAVERELELFEYSKMIEADTTTVVSEFRNPRQLTAPSTQRSHLRLPRLFGTLG